LIVTVNKEYADVHGLMSLFGEFIKFNSIHVKNKVNLLFHSVKTQKCSNGNVL